MEAELLKEIRKKATSELRQFNQNVAENNKKTADPKDLIDAWAKRNDLLSEPIIYELEVECDLGDVLRTANRILSRYFGHYTYCDFTSFNDVLELASVLPQGVANELRTLIGENNKTQTLYVRINNWLTDFIGCSTTFRGAFSSCAKYGSGGQGVASPYFYAINEGFYAATVYLTREEAELRHHASIIARSVLTTDFNGKLVIHRIYAGNIMSNNESRALLTKSLKDFCKVTDDKDLKITHSLPRGNSYYLDSNYGTHFNNYTQEEWDHLKESFTKLSNAYVKAATKRQTVFNDNLIA